MISYAALCAVDRGLPMRTPEYLNLDALFLIASFLMISRSVELSGVFTKIISSLVQRVTSAEGLVIASVLTVELTAAVIMNDAALLIFVPFLVGLCAAVDLDAGRVVALATVAANVGSALTPVGNPQNVIIWEGFSPTLFEFVETTAPLVAVGTAFVVLVAHFTLRGIRLSPPRPRPPVRVRWAPVVAAAVLLPANLLLSREGMQAAGLLVTVLVLLVVDRRALSTLDLPLIAIFALMFVDFGEISFLLCRAGVVSQLSGRTLLLASALLSQAISNVPATVTLMGRAQDWRRLLLGVNVGGLGLVSGSLANLISVRLGGVGIRDLHRYSVPAFVAALIVCLAIC